MAGSWDENVWKGGCRGGTGVYLFIYFLSFYCARVVFIIHTNYLLACCINATLYIQRMQWAHKSELYIQRMSSTKRVK